MKYRILYLLLLTVIIGFLFPFSAKSQSGDTGASKSSAGKIVLAQAVICEDLQELIPQNPTTVFSIERRKAICFTSFDPVSKKTIIYHQWIHRDRTSAKNKTDTQTASLVDLQQHSVSCRRYRTLAGGDHDSRGHILDVLRFSITE